MFRWFFSFYCIFFCLSAFAQNKTIKLTVTDAMNTPIFGAYVIKLPGNILITDSDENGNAYIPADSLKDNEFILLACTGFMADTLPVKYLKQNPTVQLKEKIYSLEEFVVTDLKPEKIIEKVSAQLTKKIKTSSSYPFPAFYGNGQYMKIVESKGKAIQLDRDYGLYTSTGNTKYAQWDIHYSFRFFPVYSAYSVRLKSNGKDTLNHHYLTGKKNPFNTNSRKIFTAMRALTLYGPLFTSSKYYNYKLIDNTNDTYTIEFSTKKEYYLKKIRALCYGTLQIDKTSFHLKSIELEHFIYHHYNLIFKWNNEARSPYSSRMKAWFSYQGDNCYISKCYLETHWKQAKNNLYKSIEVASRPYAAEQQIVEKEAWQAESINLFPHQELDATYWKSTTLIYGKYVPGVFRQLPLLLDTSKAIQDLNQYMDIEKQYRLFNYAGIWNELITSLENENQVHNLQKSYFSQILIQKLFKDPLAK